jgi:Mor family transcriptional regulator
MTNPPYLTEQEISEYGPEFVDVLRRAAAEVAGPLQAEIQHLRAQLAPVQNEVGNAFLTRMNATISAAVPNWQELNRDARFIEWTQLPDVFSGVVRQQLMQQAWNEGDAARVIAIMRAYLAEAGGGQGGYYPNTALERRRTDDRPVYAKQDVTRFYTEVATGRFKGTEAERRQIDRELSIAAAEGRIR